MILPMIVIVASNLCYHIVAKSTPVNADTFLSLTVTYLVAAICSFSIFCFSGRLTTIGFEFTKLNGTSLLFGVSIVGLEFGYVWLYRVGCQISLGSLICSIALACLLLVVGVLFYHDSVSKTQVVGIIVCIIGLVLICK